MLLRSIVVVFFIMIPTAVYSPYRMYPNFPRERTAYKTLNSVNALSVAESLGIRADGKQQKR